MAPEGQTNSYAEWAIQPHEVMSVFGSKCATGLSFCNVDVKNEAIMLSEMMPAMMPA